MVDEKSNSNAPSQPPHLPLDAAAAADLQLDMPGQLVLDLQVQQTDVPGRVDTFVKTEMMAHFGITDEGMKNEGIEDEKASPFVFANWYWRVGSSLAAAAAVALMVWFGFDSPETNHPNGPFAGTSRQEDSGLGQALAAGDVNADGSVNILDAYLLQRDIEHNRKLKPDWDFNADGKVDLADVQTLASMAVDLKGARQL